jgi:hypothetical protein
MKKVNGRDALLRVRDGKPNTDEEHRIPFYMPQLNLFIANLAPGPQQEMKLATPRGHALSIGINELQLLFQKSFSCRVAAPPSMKILSPLGQRGLQGVLNGGTNPPRRFAPPLPGRGFSREFIGIQSTVLWPAPIESSGGLFRMQRRPGTRESERGFLERPSSVPTRSAISY